jgi:magnesium transporter
MIAQMLTVYLSEPEAPGVAAKPFWIDLLQPTDEERTSVATEHGLRIPTREQLEEIESSSRLRAEGQVLTLSMPLVVPPEATSDALPAPLGFILSPALLVTTRYTPVSGFADVTARIEKGAAPRNSLATFAALIEAMIDHRADLLEALSATINSMSRQVFAQQYAAPRRPARYNRALRQMLSQVGRSGDKLSEVRESLLGLQRIVGFTCEMSQEWLGAEIRARLSTARQDLVSLTDFEAHTWSKIHFMLDAILGLISTEQNEIFKVLTIVSVVGVPPTLIASMYGMNFHYMPELSWRYGYAYALALIAVSAILPILWFKWRGWW